VPLCKKEKLVEMPVIKDFTSFILEVVAIAETQSPSYQGGVILLK